MKIMKSKSWYKYFLEMAELVASKSKDPSTKVGAVIVGEDNEILSTGFNGFPRGVNEDVAERWERPIKYLFVEHAERNAIYNAARIGTSLKGATLYINFKPNSCCAECTKAIIQSGIKKIVGNDTPFSGKGDQWDRHLAVSSIMLYEAGIELETIKEI